ncbi:MAG: PD-(D/E)XK nuclease family protein [Acidimicrobiales bacterium]|nr:PD-(D/E)XK nuclease family protein [Acidimicrobiales bacterium]MCB9371947.1 PD-(D/E)XK nuclease family protein [Microthrixaceae bacterium]
MALTPPSTLSPSKVATFRDCGLAFRYSAIDRLPEAPTVAASRGTLVHAALERLLDLPADQRTVERALGCLRDAAAAFRTDDDFTGLALDQAGEARFLAEAEALVRRYFDLEDPTAVRPVGLEVRLEATVGGLRLRGVIDRLELGDDGELVVTDYKTGRAPSVQSEQARLGGVQFYAFLCEQALGVRPARIQLLHLAEPLAIVAVPTEQSTRALGRRVEAVWQAIERACSDEDFRPRPGRGCSWCSFAAYCPAMGGDPALAPGTGTEAPAPALVAS